MEIKTFINSMQGNIVKMNLLRLIGYANILDGLSLFQKQLLIWYIQKQYLMFWIYTYGLGLYCFLI